VVGRWASRLIFKDVKVPKENILGTPNQDVEVFNAMMIPERMGTAAMTICSAKSSLDVATGYTMKRKAFGKTIANYQGINFQVAEAAILLDACRAMIYTTARAIDEYVDAKTIRRRIPKLKSLSLNPVRKWPTTPFRSWAE
jgi:butyryl-CoA dehydrogenase